MQWCPMEQNRGYMDRIKTHAKHISRAKYDGDEKSAAKSRNFQWVQPSLAADGKKRDFELYVKMLQ
ncbi:MAG: hypothetical protein Q4A65_01140 [Bacillota bacterium]|nr:hypothetical protein [Bacillota bacterium]